MATRAKETVASYVTDMLALEHHIKKAVAGQIADLEGETQFVNELQSIHGTCENHIAKLDALIARREIGSQGISETLKKATSAVLGVGAAAIDFVRTEKLPKNLRDDYTALSLANIGYVMLQTTALSLGDDEVAELAQECLADHAQCVMTLNHITPAAVVRFLQDEGLPAQANVLPQVAENVGRAWSASPAVAHAGSSHAH